MNRRVQSFRSVDGGLHNNLPDAIAHDLISEFSSATEHGESYSTLAHHLAQNSAFRARVRKLLEELS